MNKVLLECEKGHRWEVKVQMLPSHGDLYTFEDEPCPICNPPEPSYGVITVDGLWPALHEAFSYSNGFPTGYKYQAEFVIRLLQAVEEERGNCHADAYWNRKLMELAKA